MRLVPQEFGRDDEEGEKSRRELMRRIYDIEETEVHAAHKLVVVATPGGTRREAFLESGSDGLHEADDVDDMVGWLNRVTDRQRNELMSTEGSLDGLKDELLSVSRDFVAIAESLSAEGKPVDPSEIRARQEEYDRCALDLYNWATMQMRLEDPRSTDFERRRARQELEKMEAIYRSPADLQWSVILGERMVISNKIREAAGVSGSDWERYVSER